MGHVVAISEVDQLATGKARSEVLGHRGPVREELRRVIVIGQAIDHGDRGMTSEFIDIRLLESPYDQRVTESADDSSGIRDGLASAQLEVIASKEDRMPAKVSYGTL